MPGAPSPRRLLLGDDDGSVRFPALSQRHGDGVGRVNFEKMVDALPERPRMQPPVQQLRRENVRHFFDLIAGARMALHADAQRAQLFDPVPHGAARHADFAGDFRAADDDHRVVGEQREQRVDAAVGRARKSGVRHGSSDLLGDIRVIPFEMNPSSYRLNHFVATSFLRLNRVDAPTARRYTARGNARGRIRDTCSALKGRRIPAPFQGAT